MGLDFTSDFISFVLKPSWNALHASYPEQDVKPLYFRFPTQTI
jgi:hypothetical protein